MGSLPKTKKKNIPKSIHEMSKETLQETLKKKKECNAKALQTVERLCELNVDEEWFLTNLQFINQCHFDDVTVERSISKLCGYPLCDKKLEKVPTQQYHISTRYNKVFDITERKNFCSSCCYKSAMHVKKQLFTSPLWFRDQEVIPKYTVLESMKSSMGEEVVFFPDKIKLEEEIVDKNTDLEKQIDEVEKKYLKLQIGDDTVEGGVSESEGTNNVENDGKLSASTVLKEDNTEILTRDSSLKLSEHSKGAKSVEKPKPKPKTHGKQVDLVKQIETERPANDRICNSEINNKVTSSEVSTADNKATPTTKSSESSKDIKPTTKAKPKPRTKDEPIDIVKKVEKCIFEWFTLDTFFHLYGEKKLKELFQDKTTEIKQLLNSKLSLAGHNEKIDKIIQLYGLLDADLFSEKEAKMNLKPLPDYSILKEEGKSLEIKVRAFYQGQLQLKEPEKEEKTEEKDTSSDSEPVYLPLIDAHAQTALRRKILLDKLSRVLPELMRAVSLDYVLQMNDVRSLLSTFTLSAHNITFKPTEWCLISIILVKLLSQKDGKLQSALNSDSSKHEISAVLMNYELQIEYLDDLIARLTDCGNLMEKLNEINR